MLFSTDTRTWTDLNSDDIAQENELGPTSNVNFGVRRNRQMDPDIKRPYQIGVGRGRPARAGARSGVAVSYTQRQLPSHQFLQQPRDSAQRLHAPHRARPARQRPDAAGLQHRPRGSSDWSTSWTPTPITTRAIYRGVDVSFNVRIPGGGSVNGGTSTGQDHRPDLRGRESEQPAVLRPVAVHVPLQTNFKLSGTYPLPSSASG